MMSSKDQVCYTSANRLYQVSALSSSCMYAFPTCIPECSEICSSAVEHQTKNLRGWREDHSSKPPPV